jgi:hypothetical protein
VILPHLWGLGVDGVFWAEPVSNVAGGLACWVAMIFFAYIPLGRLEKERRDAIASAK